MHVCSHAWLVLPKLAVKPPLNIPPLQLNLPPPPTTNTPTHTHSPHCVFTLLEQIPTQTKGTSRTASDSNFSPFLSSSPRRRPAWRSHLPTYGGLMMTAPDHPRLGGVPNSSPHPTFMVVRASAVRSGSPTSYQLMFPKAK